METLCINAVWISLPEFFCLRTMIHWWMHPWKQEGHSMVQPRLTNPFTNRPSNYSESCCLDYFKGQCLGEECDTLGHLCSHLIMQQVNREPMYSVNKSLCHFPPHCQTNSDEENMRSWSQGIKAWSLLRASRGSAFVRALSGMFQVKTKIFPPPPLYHLLVHFCATPAGCRRCLCSEERRDGWLCTMWLGARSCGLCVSCYLVPD